MPSILNPYINFRGETRQALEFYQSIFGGTLVANTFADSGAKEAPYADQIMHGQLDTDQGYTIMASDLPPDMELTRGTNITIGLSGDNAETLRGYWAGLAVGGTISTELAPQMWGDEFGQLTDKFGIAWLVNIAIGGQS